MNESKKLLGSISALCTFGLLALIAWKAEVYGMVIRELVIFMSGGFREVASNRTTFLMMFPIVLAVVVLELPCTVVAAVLQEKILGKSGKHMLTDFSKEMGEGSHFPPFFLIVLFEELFARWLFLGLLTKIPVLSGTVAFYALFLIGNGVWALVHLYNYREKGDRKILRVLPQFVAGAFFTYVFVKYGLLAAILAHFASNTVLFVVHKVQRINMTDGLLVGYSALCAAISYALMEKPLADILPWFADNPVFRLQGWEFWDYVKVSVFLSSCFIVVFDLLLYDRGEAGKKKSDKDIGLVGHIIVIPIVIGLLYGTYALLGLFITNAPYRVLALAILFSLPQKGASGSAMARTFWSGLPDTYITMCVLLALGFWPALGWIAVKAAIYAPRLRLNKLDD
ncbi:CPBP family intramembrane metalloprotease [Candidatus Parcubacteria bacterium]|nr:CPBP family intramembrane metalloprotease [Candidatus Parcubacteria bacterium]